MQANMKRLAFLTVAFLLYSDIALTQSSMGRVRNGRFSCIMITSAIRGPNGGKTSVSNEIVLCGGGNVESVKRPILERASGAICTSLGEAA